MLRERKPERHFAFADFDRLFAIAAEDGENLADELRAIRRHDAKRVAYFIREPASRQADFKMPHVLRGSLRAEPAIRDEPGGKWILLRVGGSVFVNLRRTAVRAVGPRAIFREPFAERGKDTRRPLRRWRIVFHVAVLAIRHASRAERGEPLIAFFPELAERRVVRIA